MFVLLGISPAINFRVNLRWKLTSVACGLGADALSSTAGMARMEPHLFTTATR